jgi:hypothetical protein
LLDQETQAIIPEQTEIQRILNRGATVEQCLAIVMDPAERDRLRSYLFAARLRAAIVNAGCVLKPDQQKELLEYVDKLHS